MLAGLRCVGFPVSVGSMRPCDADVEGKREESSLETGVRGAREEVFYDVFYFKKCKLWAVLWVKCLSDEEVSPLLRAAAGAVRAAPRLLFSVVRLRCFGRGRRQVLLFQVQRFRMARPRLAAVRSERAGVGRVPESWQALGIQR